MPDPSVGLGGGWNKIGGMIAYVIHYREFLGAKISI